MNIKRCIFGTGLLATVLFAGSAFGQDQNRDRTREIRRVPRGQSPASGTIRPITRPETSVVRERPTVLPSRPTDRNTTIISRRVERPVTVIERPVYQRPVLRPVTVINRPISVATYRPVRYGTTVVQLPQRSIALQIGGLTFYASDGVYYSRQPASDTYVVVRPPIGTRVERVPSDSTVIVIDGRTNYFYDDCWYNDQLVVIEPPIGGWLYELPDDHEVILYGGERYYRYGDAVYQPGWRDGRSVYFHVDLRF
ncbi:MAG: DUF6515 family protein [Phycisphaerae bacterium]